MKACIKCRAELPDTAGHCVYCGSQQPAAAPSSGPKATMMGHPGMAEELAAKAAAAQVPPEGAFQGRLTPTKLSLSAAEQAAIGAIMPGPGAPPQQQQPYSTPPQGAPGQAHPAASSQPYGAPPQGGGPGPGPASSQSQPYGAPAQGPGPSQPYGAPAQSGGPGGGGQGQPYGAPAQSGGPGGGGQGQPYGAPPQGGGPGPGPGGGGQGQPYGAPPQGGGQGQPYGAPPQGGGPGPGGGGQGQPYGAPPQGGGPGGGGPGQPYGGPGGGGHGQPYGAPQGGGGPQQPYGGGAPFGGANLGIQNAQFGAAAHQPQFGGPNHYQDAMTEQVKPLRAPGHSGNVTEWDESLTTQMLVFGVLLVACFVAPWAVGGGKTVFSWSIFSADGAPFLAKMVPVLLAATGIVSVALGALKLGSMGRAIAATLIGLSPLAFQAATADPIRWQLIVAVVAMIVLCTGLVLRSRLLDSMLARILTTVGVAAILALYLIPENDTMMVKMLLDMVSDAPGKAKVIPIVGIGMGGIAIGLVPLFLTLLCLLVWMPATGKAGTPFLVWAVIFWPLVATLATLGISENLVDMVKANLSTLFYLPLAGAAWVTLASFGLAGVLGQRAES